MQTIKFGGMGWCVKGLQAWQDHHMEVTRFRKIVMGLVIYPAVGRGFFSCFHALYKRDLTQNYFA